MFLLLESEEEIAKAQRKLEAAIRRDFKKTTIRNIGYPGGKNVNANVNHNGTYWFWSGHYDGPDIANPRCLNWFGLFQNDENFQISVEINTAYENKNKLIAGFFAKNTETGMIYLFHSGRVGGGTKGVGKTDFLAWSSEPLEEVVDLSGDIREGVLVMPIEGIAASRSAIRYIETIVNFKKAVRAGDLATPEFKKKKKEYDDFYSESSGRRTGRRSAEIDYLSRHGDVVDALNVWRTSKPLRKDGRIVKNVLIDMGVAVGDDLVEVFEVKTSTARSDVYCAIGQLMVHGTAAQCRRVIVLPEKEKIADDLTDAFTRLNIELVTFELDEDKATIIRR
jgi:hypothetical protein